MIRASRIPALVTPLLILFAFLAVEQARPVGMTGGRHQTGAPPATFHVQGRVTGIPTDIRALNEGVRVVLVSEGAAADDSREVAVTQRGGFLVNDVPPGRYLLRVRHDPLFRTFASGEAPVRSIAVADRDVSTDTFACGSTSPKTRIETEGLRAIDFDVAEAAVIRVDQVVQLFRNDDARHDQYGIAGRHNPRIADLLGRWRWGLLTPILRQFRSRDPMNAGLRKSKREGLESVQMAWIPMDQLLQRSQGLVLTRIDDRNAWRVPTSSVQPGTFTYERVRGARLRHDTPTRRHYE